MTEIDYAWLLLARKIAGEATENELNTLQTLLPKYAFLQIPLQLFSCPRTNSPEAPNSQDIENAYDKFLERIKREKH